MQDKTVHESIQEILRRNGGDVPVGSIDFRKLAKPGLQHYAIAAKNVYEVWPERFTRVLAEAHKKYDAGTHEMMQGRSGDVIIQYLVPRKTPRRPEPYFSHRPLEFA